MVIRYKILVKQSMTQQNATMHKFNEGRIDRLMMVREFHQTFGLTIYGECEDIEKEIALRAKLIDEEMREMNDAFDEWRVGDGSVAAVAKEIADVEYVLLGTHVALADLSSVFINGGVDLLSIGRRIIISMLDRVKDSQGNPLIDSFDKIFAEVHRSNMSKMGEDGKPSYREDGKLLKGPNYKPANLSWL